MEQKWFLALPVCARGRAGHGNWGMGKEGICPFHFLRAWAKWALEKRRAGRQKRAWARPFPITTFYPKWHYRRCLSEEEYLDRANKGKNVPKISGQ